MADKKITELDEVTTVSPVYVLPIVDVGDDGETKKVQAANLLADLDADNITAGIVPLEHGGTESDLSAEGPGIVVQLDTGDPLGVLLCNFAATTDPGVGDDEGDGYAVGSRWFNVTADTEWVCLDASTGAAVWIETTQGAGSFLPLNAALNAQSSAYELAAGDAGKIIECDGTFTVTLPDGLDTGFQVTIVNVGSGTIALAAATTLQSKGGADVLADQYGAAVVYHRGSNVWLAIGDLS